MNIESFSYHPMSEKIVQILMTKTQNYNPTFFRLQANFYLSLAASCMNIKVSSPITGKIPVNFYGVNLSGSGSGKGFSTNILENEILKGFREIFMNDLFPKKAEIELDLEAHRRHQSLGISQTEALDRLKKEYRSYGAIRFITSEGTAAAIKQYRNKILLTRLGSINFVVDEIGFNLSKIEDLLHTFLELYDKGLIKEKLTKNTDTAERFQELIGSTPTNLLMFGTPSKLLDGAKTESDFFTLLEAGYARRSFFAYSKKNANEQELTPEQLYDLLSQPNQDKDLAAINFYLSKLADINLVGLELQLPRDSGIHLMAYKQWCQERAKQMPEFAEIQRAELEHRYFKALKLASAYAFIDCQAEVSIEHLNQAIKFTEESGVALEQIFQQEKPYERLARYLGDSKGQELTQVDIQNDLPFYKGSQAHRNELMNMAIAYGYKNNIIIRKNYRDGIEFFSGETLEETNLDKLIIARSQDYADGYTNHTVAWKDLTQFVKKPNENWVNHHTMNGHRSNATMSKGFNMVVLDIDDETTITQVQSLLQDYTYIIHTTKRHQVPDENGKCIDRFRLILPTNYRLDMEEDDYHEFMCNLRDWLPFNGLDESTFQRSRKWACTENCQVFTNEGKLLDILPFIPKTSRSEDFKKSQVNLTSLNNIERWFANRMVTGNRNNNLAQYGFMLLDAGFAPQEIESILIAFNGKLDNPLDETEILSTVMTSINNRYKGH